VSELVWARALQPPIEQEPVPRVYDIYDCDFRVARTLSIPLRDEQLVDLPEPRTFQVLSRAGLMLTAVGLPSRDQLAPFLHEDPFSVGLYCAVQNGPDDYRAAKQMAYTPPEDFARMYRSLRSSKQFFRQIANIPPSIVSIFLGIMGPQYIFSHSRWACLHALEQAEFDLQHGLVRSALVAGAFSLEDPLLSMRVRRSIADHLVLCEGAAAVVLTASNRETNWRDLNLEDGEYFYGTAHDLILLATRSETNADYAEQFRTVHRRAKGDLVGAAVERS
jgi:hypothetical protein